MGKISCLPGVSQDLNSFTLPEVEQKEAHPMSRELENRLAFAMHDFLFALDKKNRSKNFFVNLKTKVLTYFVVNSFAKWLAKKLMDKRDKIFEYTNPETLVFNSLAISYAEYEEEFNTNLSLDDKSLEKVAQKVVTKLEA
ncbi:hypothetical protein K8R66_01575 [bacterium]|nr:hypothetical protein [bacterium]